MQRPRIIVFICSPIEESESELIKLAKKTKKNNTSVDLILFGDIDESNQAKCDKFIAEVQGSEGSNMVTIEPSSYLLSDQLIATPIMQDSTLRQSAAVPGPSGGDAATGDSSDFPFGIDPSVDPELALALRMSMEEEKNRQEKIAREEAEKAKQASLETVKEEGESEPLLDKDGQPSNSKKDEDKGGKSDDADKMDTS